MSATQLKRETPKLDAHVEFWFKYPTASLKEASEVLGVTITHCSIVKNTDLFRKLYSDKMQGYEKDTLYGVRDQAIGIASQALEKLGKKLETCEDGDFLLRTADTLMGKDGRVSGPQTQVNVVISREELASARERLLEG